MATRTRIRISMKELRVVTRLIWKDLKSFWVTSLNGQVRQQSFQNVVGGGFQKQR